MCPIVPVMVQKNLCTYSQFEQLNIFSNIKSLLSVNFTALNSNSENRVKNSIHNPFSAGAIGSKGTNGQRVAPFFQQAVAKSFVCRI
jgi:hypothetical protein